MTLTIHKEEDDQRQLAVTVEVAEARVQKAMRQTARKLARDVNIPGFRRGKVPYGVMVRRFGEGVIRADTIEELVQPVFQEVMAEIEEEPYAQPSLVDLEQEPLVLKFSIPLSPTVELGDYRIIRKEIEPVQVTDEALAEALEHIREHHQVVEDVDRPVEAGDLVTLAGTGVLLAALDEDEDEAAATEAATESDVDADADPEAAADADFNAEDEAEEIEEKIIFNEDRLELVMDADKAFPGTPFVDNLLGMSAGEEKTFSFTFPADYEEEDLAGKEAEFTISILNVQMRELPELTDELAQQEGDYETVEALRETLQQRLQDQAESEAKDALIEGMIDDLLADATLVFPPAAVEERMDQMLASFQSQVQRSGWEWQDFLTIQGQDEDDIREQFRETAVTRLKRDLVLREFVLIEKLKIKEEDVDAYVEERVADFGDNEELKESMRNYYRSGYGFDMVSSAILMDKVYERIESIFTGNAPDLDTLDEDEVSEENLDEEE